MMLGYSAQLITRIGENFQVLDLLFEILIPTETY